MKGTKTEVVLFVSYGKMRLHERSEEGILPYNRLNNQSMLQQPFDPNDACKNLEIKAKGTYTHKRRKLR